jgi:hypothetical protein
MTRTYAVTQLATVAAGARPCAFGHAWLRPSVATGGMKQDGNAITRPLGRLRD